MTVSLKKLPTGLGHAHVSETLSQGAAAASAFLSSAELTKFAYFAAVARLPVSQGELREGAGLSQLPSMLCVDAAIEANSGDGGTRFLLVEDELAKPDDPIRYEHQGLSRLVIDGRVLVFKRLNQLNSVAGIVGDVSAGYPTNAFIGSASAEHMAEVVGSPTVVSVERLVLQTEIYLTRIHDGESLLVAFSPATPLPIKAM